MDETPNMFEAGSVEIPETRVELTAQQRDYIHQNHHPLAPSDYHGVDHYLSLHKYICHCTAELHVKPAIILHSYNWLNYLETRKKLVFIC